MEFLTFVVILGRQVFSNDQPGFMLLNYTNFPSQSPRFDIFFSDVLVDSVALETSIFLSVNFCLSLLSAIGWCVAGFEIWNLWTLGLKGRRSHSKRHQKMTSEVAVGYKVPVYMLYMIYDLYNWWLIELWYIIILHTVHAMVEIYGRGPKW